MQDSLPHALRQSPLRHADSTLNFQSLALCIYVALFLSVWLLSSYLPEQFFRDQLKLAESLEVDGEGLSSFRATAMAYTFVTFGHPQWLIPLCALAYVALLAGFTRRGSALPGALLLFVPSLLLNLIVLGKETLVTGMSALIVFSLLRSDNSKRALLLMIALYALYGSFVRPYFLAIVGLFLIIAAIQNLRFNGRVIAGVVAFTVFCLLPSELYSLAAQHRDTANNYALFRGGFDIRTMVHNVVMPDNPFEFLLNYAHSLLTLNLPFLFFFGPRDALITLTNLFVLWLLWRGISRGDGAQRNLALLMLAHVLVLCLFEPDVGSYSRHLLSVSLYAAASLTLLPRLRFVP